MDNFIKDQNSWPRYGNTLFYVTFLNMYRWRGVKNNGDFLRFSILEVFVKSFQFTFWAINF